MAKRRIVVKSFTVTDGEAKEFINLLKHNLTKLSPEELENIYLFDHSNRAIILSIDSEWMPFLGFTRGFNPHYNRKMIFDEGTVLNITIDALMERENERAGGRIFLSKASVVYKRGGRVRTLCTFSWQGDDPYKALLEFTETL